MSDEIKQVWMDRARGIEWTVPGQALWHLNELNDFVQLAVARELQRVAEETQAKAFKHQCDEWRQSPMFQTFVDLKHGVVGDALAALQDGEISRGRAAECLAEIAHGATELHIPAPKWSFGEEEIPAEVCDQLRAQLAAQETTHTTEHADYLRCLAIVEHLGSWRDRDGAFYDLTNPECEVQERLIDRHAEALKRQADRIADAVIKRGLETGVMAGWPEEIRALVESAAKEPNA